MSIENLIYRSIERYWASKYNPRYGIVTSYDPDKHAAKIAFQPENQESGWIPIHAHHIGDGWGILVGLQIGDQVKLDHQESDFEVGSVVARVHSDEEKPPRVEAGEMLLKHQKAGQIFFDKNKNITWTGTSGQIIQTDSAGNVYLRDSAGGEVFISGGKVHLGSKDASSPVALCGGGCATKVFAV